MDPTLNQRQTLGRMILGNGEAGKQGDNMRLDPLYQEHVIEAQSNGMQPLTREQWIQQYLQSQRPQTVSGLMQTY